MLFVMQLGRDWGREVRCQLRPRVGGTVSVDYMHLVLQTRIGGDMAGTHALNVGHVSDSNFTEMLGPDRGTFELCSSARLCIRRG